MRICLLTSVGKIRRRNEKGEHIFCPTESGFSPFVDKPLCNKIAFN